MGDRLMCEEKQIDVTVSNRKREKGKKYVCTSCFKIFWTNWKTFS